MKKFFTKLVNKLNPAQPDIVDDYGDLHQPSANLYNNQKAYKTLLARVQKMKANLIELKNIPSSTPLGLRGKHQYENASTAYTAAKTIIPNISKLNVIKGLKRTRWHGRIEYRPFHHHPRGLCRIGQCGPRNAKNRKRINHDHRNRN